MSTFTPEWLRRYDEKRLQSVPASESARPEIDYTLSSQDIALLESALTHYKEHLQDMEQMLGKMNAAKFCQIDLRIARCRDLQDKFTAGYETVIRDVQP